MKFSAEKIPYNETGAFSQIVNDYLAGDEMLRDFYTFSSDIRGIREAVEVRNQFPVNREVLHNVLTDQYSGIPISDKVKSNIESLLSPNTFTVCTAHQPNIFTGHLYFIYKILHAIKLSEELSAAMPDKKFVPVYYMGSEDADLAELGEVRVKGTKYVWQTDQKGAVGRMKLDKNFSGLLQTITTALSADQNGKQISEALSTFYKEGTSLASATFHFVNFLFAKFGLVILLPDNRALKSLFIPVIKKEIREKFSQHAVAGVAARFPKKYKVQAAGRNINLFYLKDDLRERIEESAAGFSVSNSSITFSKEQINAGIAKYPERFSPNVILRPVFQEMILPNVAFIGGGGELAYWLELRQVFRESNVFLPPLFLRNSFSLISKRTSESIASMGFNPTDFFKQEHFLVADVVKRNSNALPDLANNKKELHDAYDKIKNLASEVDATLGCHVHSLRTNAVNRIEILEKKIMRAEKKKFEAEQRKIIRIKNALYPEGTLQERSDNILDRLSIYGLGFIDTLYENSGGCDQLFTILTEE